MRELEFKDDLMEVGFSERDIDIAWGYANRNDAICELINVMQHYNFNNDDSYIYDLIDACQGSDDCDDVQSVSP